MSNRRSVIAGLGAGVVAGLLLVAALVAFVPDAPVAAASPTPFPPAPTSAVPLPSAPPEPSPVSSSLPPATAFHIGRPAPPLVIPQVGGGTIDLAALRGRPVWVNFMATWCGPCRDEFPIMNRFAIRHAADGLVVVAVDVREEEGTVAAFANALNAQFPLGLDLDGAAQDAWDAFFLPVHFWIDAEGIVRDGALGGIPPDLMVEGLRRIMPGVDVSP